MKYIFGYGSLLNKKSRGKTLKYKRNIAKATLLGYQRKMNVLVNGYLYLNLVPKKNKEVEGIIIPLSFNEFKKMKKRERGYECVEITERLKRKMDNKVYTFIAPNRKYPNSKILLSYILTCLSGVQKNKRTKWLKEIIIENAIKNDIGKPIYKNAAMDLL